MNMWCNTIPNAPPKSRVEGKFAIGLSDLFVVDEEGELVDASDEQDSSDPLRTWTDAGDFASDFSMDDIDDLVDAGVSVSELYEDGIPTDLEAWIDVPEDVDPCEEYNREHDVAVLAMQADNVLDEAAKWFERDQPLKAKETIVAARNTLNAATHGMAHLFIDAIDEKMRKTRIENEQKRQTRWMEIKKLSKSREEFILLLETDPIYNLFAKKEVSVI